MTFLLYEYDGETKLSDCQCNHNFPSEVNPSNQQNKVAKKCKLNFKLNQDDKIFK